MSYLLESNCFLLYVAAMRLEIIYVNSFLPNDRRYAANIGSYGTFRREGSTDSMVV